MDISSIPVVPGLIIIAVLWTAVVWYCIRLIKGK